MKVPIWLKWVWWIGSYLSAVAVILLGLMYFSLFGFFSGDPYVEKGDVDDFDYVEAKFPDMTVAIGRQAAHAFLPEFHRILVVTSERGRETKEMSLDSGGFTQINLYRMPNGDIRMIGKMDRYDIPATSRSPKNASDQPVFLGAFDRDDDRTYRFHTAKEKQERGIRETCRAWDGIVDCPLPLATSPSVDSEALEEGR